jgi:hypothetical protein
MEVVVVAFPISMPIQREGLLSETRRELYKYPMLAIISGWGTTSTGINP